MPRLSLTTRQKKLLGSGVAVIVILGLITVVVARRDRETVLQNSLRNLDQATSYHVRAEMLITLPPRLADGSTRPLTNVVANVEGDVRKNESGTPELTGTFLSELRGSGARFYADGDIRIFNDQVAFRLDELPVAVNPSRNLLRRWTYVPGVILQTYNGSALRETMAQVATELEYDGPEEVGGVTYAEYRGQLSPELKRQVIAVAQHTASHNHAWNILARLLNAYPAHTMEILVDEDEQQVRQVLVAVGQVQDGQFIRRAMAKVDITDVGKDVTIDRPEQQATARPEVFRQLFRTGEINPQ